MYRKLRTDREMRAMFLVEREGLEGGGD